MNLVEQFQKSLENLKAKAGGLQEQSIIKILEEFFENFKMHYDTMVNLHKQIILEFDQPIELLSARCKQSSEHFQDRMSICLESIAAVEVEEKSHSFKQNVSRILRKLSEDFSSQLSRIDGFLDPEVDRRYFKKLWETSSFRILLKTHLLSAKDAYDNFHTYCSLLNAKNLLVSLKELEIIIKQVYEHEALCQDPSNKSLKWISYLEQLTLSGFAIPLSLMHFKAGLSKYEKCLIKLLDHHLKLIFSANSSEARAEQYLLLENARSTIEELAQGHSSSEISFESRVKYFSMMGSYLQVCDCLQNTVSIGDLSDAQIQNLKEQYALVDAFFEENSEDPLARYGNQYWHMNLKVASTQNSQWLTIFNITKGELEIYSEPSSPEKPRIRFSIFHQVEELPIQNDEANTSRSSSALSSEAVSSMAITASLSGQLALHISSASTSPLIKYFSSPNIAAALSILKDKIDYLQLTLTSLGEQALLDACQEMWGSLSSTHEFLTAMEQQVVQEEISQKMWGVYLRLKSDYHDKITQAEAMFQVKTSNGGLDPELISCFKEASEEINYFFSQRETCIKLLSEIASKKRIIRENDKKITYQTQAVQEEKEQIAKLKAELAACQKELAKYDYISDSDDDSSSESDETKPQKTH